jgi:glutathione reductase (NADPH)
MNEYDLVVIGGGSGGVRAARIAAGHGAKVAICEEFRYGGTCVIRGCVPKKMLVYASHFHEEFADSQHYGWDTQVNNFSWQTLISNKDKEINRLNGIYESLLKNAGVDVLHGRGVLLDKHTVQVGDARLSAKTILIATGGTPYIPVAPGIEHCITSNEAFHLEEMPKSVLVAGGGYIAVEFAGIFNGLGAKVDLLYRSEQILRGFDDDIRAFATQEYAKKGVNIITNSIIESVQLEEDGSKTVKLNGGESANYDCVLLAIGRLPNTDGLGLETAGVELGSKGEILVNEASQTNVDNIYAVGDVTDRIALTPVATMEGHAFADSLFGAKPRLPDHANVPSAVFSQPPIASVGLSEADARAKYNDIKTFRSEFRTLKHSITDNQERTLMKLVVDAKSDKVVGAHMMGDQAAEIMQGIAIAIKAGASKADFDATVGIHPSSAEEFCTMRTPD